MNQIALSYALTTSDRVKTRLGMTGTAFNVVLDAIIAGVTDLIEGECGGKRFLLTTYSNEVYTIFNANMKYLALNQAPVGTVTAVQYRAGLKSDPNWTDFNTDDWDLSEDGKSGLLRIWSIGGIEVNAIRVSYTAGYKIDFSNAGSPTAHTLPFDISDLAERLTIKLFKKREHEGKASESFEGGTVTWKELIDEADKQIIARHRRLPAFV